LIDRGRKKKKKKKKGRGKGWGKIDTIVNMKMGPLRGKLKSGGQNSQKTAVVYTKS